MTMVTGVLYVMTTGMTWMPPSSVPVGVIRSQCLRENLCEIITYKLSLFLSEGSYYFKVTVKVPFEAALLIEAE